MSALLVLATIVAVLVLVVGEQRGARPLRWIAKPLASAGFLAVAFSEGALDHAYGRAVGVGLVLSFLGDVLLLADGARRAFLLGLVSFAFAHVAFGYAFTLQGTSLAGWAAGGAIAGALGFAVARWLVPYADPPLRLPVGVYVGVISAMLASAAGAVAAGATILIGLGAVAFAVSDLAVGRERFVDPEGSDSLWGLPLYYTAQLLLAFSVGQPGIVPG